MNPIQDPGLNSADTRVTEKDLEREADRAWEAAEALVWIWAEATGGLQKSASLESLSALLRGHCGGCREDKGGGELSVDCGSLMGQVRGGEVLLRSVAVGMELGEGTSYRPRGQSPPALGNVCEEESKGGRNQGDLGLGRPYRRFATPGGGVLVSESPGSDVCANPVDTQRMSPRG